MTASDAPSAASARVSATTEPFLAFREILIAKFGRPNAVDAFEHVCGLVNLGVERRTMRAVLRNDHLRKFFGHVDADDPALARAYLDARRGMLPAPPPTAMHDSPNKFSAKMTVRLTSDDAFFARSAGALFRVPERIHAQDLLAAMRRLRPPVPDVDRVSVADVLAFVDEWDSSDYLRRDVGVMHAVDFVLFLRFAAADEDARGVTNDLGIAACVPGSTAARLAATAAATVRRQAVDTIASKRAFATRDARRALARREGEALAGCLREELAVYGAQRDPAVGGLERPHAFRVTFEPGRGCVAKLTPEPTLALALAASDDDGAGFVTPAETALALAQCRVPLTAVESAAFGEHLARRPGARSSRHLWCVDEVLETLDCEPLPGAESPEDFPVVVAAWRAGARRAIEAEYLGGAATDAETREGSSDDSADDSAERDGESRRSVVPTYDVDLELLRHVAAPAPLATASPAVAKAAEACLAGYRAFARFLAAFDNELGRAGSGGSGGRGCVTVSNVRYAGACARVASPSVRVAARLETLADAFPPGDFFSASGLIPGRGVTVRTTGARERLIDWRAMLDGCGPSAALLAQEKAAGSAVGGVVSLRACVASAAPGPLHAPGEPVKPGVRDGKAADADAPRFDRDAEAVAASLAAHLFERLCALRRCLELADERDEGFLTRRAFVSAIRSAGLGEAAFGEEDLAWVATACHHPFLEDAVVYPKYLALVLVAMEREVLRRADAAGARARARAEEEAKAEARNAWAEETARVAESVAQDVTRRVAAVGTTNERGDPKR